MLTLESTTAERLAVTITTTADPTGSVPEFAVTQGPDPTVWVPGSWTGGWDPISGEVSAASAVIGAGQVLAVTAGQWRLYARWQVGAERPVRLAAVLQVT